LDGDHGLLDIVQESKDLKFDMWRTWFMGSKAQNTIATINTLDSGVFNQIRPFTDFVNTQGIVLNANVFVDAQDIVPDFTKRANLWKAVGETVQGTVIALSYGNQRDKNGTRDDTMVDPRVTWSKGSWTADPNPYQPLPIGTASFAEFHPRQDLPAALLDTVASPVTLQIRDNVQVPLIISEPPKFGTNGTAPQYDAAMARRFAQHYSAEVAGMVFHNYFSQRSLVMDGLTRDIAAAWQSRIIE
jgi:hypothetical protein